MTFYDDDVIRIDDTGLTIRSFLLPGRSRHVRFDEIARVDLITLGFFTGRHQLVGIGPLRPRLFFHWDRQRSTKTHAVLLDRGKVLRLAITPSDPERVLGIISDRITSR